MTAVLFNARWGGPFPTREMDPYGEGESEECDPYGTPIPEQIQAECEADFARGLAENVFLDPYQTTEKGPVAE